MLAQPEYRNGIRSTRPFALIHDPAFLDLEPLRQFSGVYHFDLLLAHKPSLSCTAKRDLDSASIYGNDVASHVILTLNVSFIRLKMERRSAQQRNWPQPWGLRPIKPNSGARFFNLKFCRVAFGSGLVLLRRAIELQDAVGVNLGQAALDWRSVRIAPAIFLVLAIAQFAL